MTGRIPRRHADLNRDAKDSRTTATSTSSGGASVMSSLFDEVVLRCRPWPARSFRPVAREARSPTRWTRAGTSLPFSDSWPSPDALLSPPEQTRATSSLSLATPSAPASGHRPSRPAASTSTSASTTSATRTRADSWQADPTCDPSWTGWVTGSSRPPEVPAPSPGCRPTQSRLPSDASPTYLPPGNGVTNPLGSRGSASRVAAEVNKPAFAKPAGRRWRVHRTRFTGRMAQAPMTAHTPAAAYSRP
jgi:hypothetical protein